MAFTFNQLARVSAVVCLATAGFGAARAEVIGTVASHRSVYIESDGVHVAVEAHAPQTVVAGDTVTTRGLESWAAVHVGRSGLVEVGPDSSVTFDRVDRVYRATIKDGGLRYALDAGMQLVVEAGDSLVLIGAEGLTGVIPVAAGSGASGAVVLDAGRVLVRNDSGTVNLVHDSGASHGVPPGMMMAFNGGASMGSPVSVQVGAPPPPPRSSGRRGAAAWWSSLSPQAKAAIILGGTGAAYLIYREFIDDDPPGSPR